MNALTRENLIAIDTTPKVGDHGVVFDFNKPFRVRNGAEIVEIAPLAPFHLSGRVRPPRNGKTEPHFWYQDSGRSLIRSDFDLINTELAKPKPKPLRVARCEPVDLRPFLERPACARPGDIVHVRARVIDFNLDGTLLLQFEQSGGDGHLPSTIVAIESGGVAEGDRVEIAPETVGDVVAVDGGEAWVRQPDGEGFEQAHGTYRVDELRRV